MKLAGLEIVSHPLLDHDFPNFRLAPGEYIGPEFRARMDAWCDEFFGRSPFFLIMQGNKIAASSHNIQQIRAAFSERYPPLEQVTAQEKT